MTKPKMKTSKLHLKAASAYNTAYKNKPGREGRGLGNGGMDEGVRKEGRLEGSSTGFMLVEGRHSALGQGSSLAGGGGERL
jgi:hypothetical protein